jgi:Family of unknown function (DUF6226)
MNKDRPGSQSPTPEAYGRVTNPERFAFLHAFAAELLDYLDREFDVERMERYGMDSELEQDCVTLRPTVSLVPADRAAASIVVAFSGFPGLRVRCGRWCTVPFPTCGCDACNETAEGEIARLKSLIADVIEGRFSEAIQISAAEDAWLDCEFWSAGGRSHQRLSLDREHGRRLLAQSGRSSYVWRPWSRRKAGTPAQGAANSDKSGSRV